MAKQYRCRSNRRGRGRHDVRGRGGPARQARGADRPCREAGREDPHLRRRALQFHQHQHRAGRTSCPRIRTSARARCRATRRRISWRWSKSTASATTRSTRGQLFCDDSAEQIIQMLKAECAAGDVDWRMPCKVDGAGTRRRRLPDRHRQRRHRGRQRRDRHRRPVDPEDRRHRLRLPHRRAVRPERGRAAPRPGAADLRRPGLGSRSRRWPASRWKWKSRPAPARARAASAAISAKTCCSPTAACPARPSCRFPATGSRARRSSSICCRKWMWPKN